MKAGGLLALALVIAVAGCGLSDDEGSATTAEIHCETWVSQRMGIPTGDLQFSHEPTESEDAPSYSVNGTVVGGGATQDYRCDTTFDGDETWALDDFELGGG